MAYRSGMREMWIMARGYWLSLAGMMRYFRNFPEDDMWCSDMLGGAFLEKPVVAAVPRRSAAPALTISRAPRRWTRRKRTATLIRPASFSHTFRRLRLPSLSPSTGSPGWLAGGRGFARLIAN